MHLVANREATLVRGFESRPFLSKQLHVWPNG